MSAESFEPGRHEELLRNFTITAAAFWSYPDQYKTLQDAAAGVVMAMDDEQLAALVLVYEVAAAINSREALAAYI